MNTRNIQAEFKTWLKANHNKVAKDSDLSVQEIWDNRDEINVICVVFADKEGKAYFDKTATGFEFESFKEW